MHRDRVPRNDGDGLSNGTCRIEKRPLPGSGLDVIMGFGEFLGAGSFIRPTDQDDFSGKSLCDVDGRLDDLV